MKCPLCGSEMEEVVGSTMPLNRYWRCARNKYHWITHGERLKIEEGIGEETIEKMRRREKSKISIHSFIEQAIDAARRQRHD